MICSSENFDRFMGSALFVRDHKSCQATLLLNCRGFRERRQNGGNVIVPEDSPYGCLDLGGAYTPTSPNPLLQKRSIKSEDVQTSLRIPHAITFTVPVTTTPAPYC